jgi:hypothetical protein
MEGSRQDKNTENKYWIDEGKEKVSKTSKSQDFLEPPREEGTRKATALKEAFNGNPIFRTKKKLGKAHQGTEDSRDSLTLSTQKMPEKH